MIPDLKHKILILSGDLGEGHKQVANAVLEASNILQPDTDVVVVDFLQLIFPHSHSIGISLYIQGLKTFPAVYGYLYTRTRRANFLSYIFKKIRLYGFNALLRLLDEVQPTVVVCTFPGAAEAMSLLKSKGYSTPPAVTIITDHTDHDYWIHPHTDHYLVGSYRVKSGLMDLQIPEEFITVTGIPVRQHFDQTFDRHSLCMQHGFDPESPIVMVMGGGYGMMGNGISKLITSGALPKRVQFIIICGHNVRLKETLSKVLIHSEHKIVVTGYVNNVHEFMAISDLIITKPGGVTISEAIALELPMLLYRSYPGQEQDNASFLLESGAAFQAEDDEDMSYKLNYLVNKPYALLHMKSKARNIKEKNAAFKALDSILLTKSVERTSPEPESLFRFILSKPRWVSAINKSAKRKNRMGVR